MKRIVYTSLAAAMVSMVGCGGGGATVEGDKHGEPRVLEGGQTLSIEATSKSKIDPIETMVWRIDQTEGPSTDKVQFTNTDCEDHTETSTDEHAHVWTCALGVEASKTIKEEHRFKVSVHMTNAYGESDKVDYSLRVTPTGDTGLAADAGFDRTVTPGEAVEMNCMYSGGALESGEQPKYNWTIEDNGGYSLTSFQAIGETATFTAPSPTTTTDLTFACEVTDGVGVSDTDEVTITVRGTSDLAPLQANAGSAQSVEPGDAVTLDATGTTDPENLGTPIYYQWEQVAGTDVELVNAKTAQASFITPADIEESEDMRFRVSVSRQPIDASTTFADSETAQTVVHVDAASELSVISNAGSPQEVEEGALVTLDGTGSSDPEGGQLYYLWEQVSGPDVEISNRTASKAYFTAPDVDADTTLRFTLMVAREPISGVDFSPENPANVASSETYVLVNDPDSENTEPLIADAGSSQTVEPNESVTLEGAVLNPPPNTTIYYQWEQVDGPTVTVSNANNKTASFVAPDTGSNEELVFRLSVKDEPIDASTTFAPSETQEVSIAVVVPAAP